MKLKEFPLVMEGCMEICMDQYHGESISPRPKGEQDIPEFWRPAFQEAEKELARIHENWPTLVDLHKRFPRECEGFDWWDMIDSDDETSRTLDWIWMPINESQRDIMSLVMTHRAVQFCVDYLFYSYFDGELRGILSPKA